MTHEPKKGERPVKKRPTSRDKSSRGRGFGRSGRPQLGYMCGVTWEYEAGNTDIKVFPTLSALKADFTNPEAHLAECGYVKVKITPLLRVRGRLA